MRLATASACRNCGPTTAAQLSSPQQERALTAEEEKDQLETGTRSPLVLLSRTKENRPSLANDAWFPPQLSLVGTANETNSSAEHECQALTKRTREEPVVASQPSAPPSTAASHFVRRDVSTGAERRRHAQGLIGGIVEFEEVHRGAKQENQARGKSRFCASSRQCGSGKSDPCASRSSVRVCSCYPTEIHR
ncbi:hypothetical protein MTO96_020735 [Rhipicephalus appendiculatus]